jgi:hypothetical protein
MAMRSFRHPQNLSPSHLRPIHPPTQPARPGLQGPDNGCHQLLSPLAQVPGVLVGHLCEARQHHDPRQASAVALARHGPAVGKAARLREDHDARVGRRFHEVDQVLAADLEVGRGPRPRSKGRAERVGRGADVGVTLRDVGMVVLRPRPQVRREDAPA